MAREQDRYPKEPRRARMDVLPKGRMPPPREAKGPPRPYGTRPAAEVDHGKLRKERVKSEARSFLFDFMGAVIVLLILIGSLYTYTGNWPPLVVVQSGSMQHSDTRSEVGVIDTGDLVFVKEITERTDIIPYLDGRITNYRTYGSYGDVIIYKPNGNGTRTAIIHRAVIYIEFNSTNYDPLAMTGGSFDIPSMGRYDVDSSIVIDDYEWPMNLRSAGLVIDLRKILDNFRNYRTEPHGGYLTKGDDNPGVDQTSDFFNNDPPWIEPIKKEWVIGKSVGELPWFGLIKLMLEGNRGWPQNSMRNLIISLAVIILLPFGVEVGISITSNLLKRREEEKKGTSLGKSVPRHQGPGKPAPKLEKRAFPGKRDR